MCRIEQSSGEASKSLTRADKADQPRRGKHAQGRVQQALKTRQSNLWAGQAKQDLGEANKEPWARVSHGLSHRISEKAIRSP